MPHYDLLLRGGLLMDPASRRTGTADVAIQGGVVAALGDLSGHSADREADVTGLIVTPGLVDMHAHVYPRLPFDPDSLPCLLPDVPALRCGVTTVVDAGTCGEADFPKFYEDVIRRAKVRVFAFVNIFEHGMLRLAEEGRCAALHPQRAAAVAAAYPGVAVGIKSAHYRPFPPFDEARPAWASVDAALEAGELAGLPAMLDVFPDAAARSYPDILARMRPGDIHAHVFAPHIPSLDAQGQVAPWMWAARERGVRFDLAHGGKSFAFAHARPAIAQGFYPDAISSDLYAATALGPAISLPHVMGKCLALGMPLEAVVQRATQAPAQLLRLPDAGSLAVGARADVAVFRMVREPVGFTDATGLRLPASQYLDCRMTVLAGDVAYDPYGLSSLPLDAPPAA